MEVLLKKLGLTEREAKTFLRLMELGAQPVSVMAKQIDTPRSTMYLTLESLKKQHLIEEFERSGVKYVKCIPVSAMAHVIEARKRESEHLQKLFEENRGELEKIESKLSITPSIRFLEGKDKVASLYEHIAQTSNFVAIQNPSLVKAHMSPYDSVIPETLRKSKGRAKELLFDCPEARKYKEQHGSKFHQIRIFKNISSFTADIIIFPDKLYMIAYGKKQVSATEIVSLSMAESQKAIFDQLWTANA